MRARGARGALDSRFKFLKTRSGVCTLVHTSATTVDVYPWVPVPPPTRGDAAARASTSPHGDRDARRAMRARDRRDRREARDDDEAEGAPRRRRMVWAAVGWRARGGGEVVG
jgi:hypothetical protein